MVEGAKVKPQPAICLGTKTLDSERDIISCDAGVLRKLRWSLDWLRRPYARGGDQGGSREGRERVPPECTCDRIAGVVKKEARC
jgi:hypothetical protein